MNKFKVGDEVICIDPNEGCRFGAIGTYKGIADSDSKRHNGKIIAKVDMETHSNLWLYEDSLRKLTKLDKVLK